MLIFSREIHRIAIPGINVTVEINIKNITKVQTSNMKVIFRFRDGFSSQMEDGSICTITIKKLCRTIKQ